MSSSPQSEDNTPLNHMDEWEDDLKRRYPEQDAKTKSQEEFRDYRAEARPSVKEFYRLNHRYQTLDFVRNTREQYLPLRQRKMGIWEAMQQLSEIIDASDPDTELPQIEHAIQSAEGIRQDGHPDWFMLTGLIHDLGKGHPEDHSELGREIAERTATRLRLPLREAETLKIPYMGVVGEREAADGTVAVRKRGAGKKQEVMSRDDFVLMLADEIATRALG